VDTAKASLYYVAVVEADLHPSEEPDEVRFG
jgi:hypothetical protein